MKQVEMSKEDLRKMQSLQLEILLELDRICRKHNIKYNVSGGTLLGTVRHQGFIPWDDDIDVRMLRDEYEKFREVCAYELDADRYYFQNNIDEYEYRWAFSRLLINDTKYVRCGHEKLGCRNGVFIDIFPSDGVADNVVVAAYQEVVALFLRKALWSPVAKEILTKPIERAWFTMLSKIPKEHLLKVQSHLMNVGKKFKAKRVDCFGLARSDIRRWGFSKKTKKQSGFRREWLEDVIEMPFEGHMIFVPRKYDQWLLTAYGTKYMELPPVEKRTIHHYPSAFQLCEPRVTLRSETNAE